MAYLVDVHAARFGRVKQRLSLQCWSHRVFQTEFKSKERHKQTRLRKLVLIGQYMRRVLCGRLRKRYAMCSHFDVSLGCFDIVAVDGKHVN